MHYFYVLKNEKNELYYGCTSDLKKDFFNIMIAILYIQKITNGSLFITKLILQKKMHGKKKNK